MNFKAVNFLFLVLSLFSDAIDIAHFLQSLYVLRYGISSDTICLVIQRDVNNIMNKRRILSYAPYVKIY